MFLWQWAHNLDYLSRHEVRWRVQNGLNRQESVHALVQALAVGQLGEFRLRDLHDQLNRASCLHLVTAMVITWNAAYLSAAVDKLHAMGVPLTAEQLAHILPVMSEHINRLFMSTTLPFCPECARYPW